MIFIKNVNVVLEDRIIYDGEVLICGDKIEKTGKKGEISVPEGADVIDGEGNYLGPGFVDIHVHGGGGHLFFHNPEKAAIHFLNHGQTTVLATGYPNFSKDEFVESIKKIQYAMKNTEAGKAIAGIYTEGLYMNNKYGADPDSNKWMGEIKKEEFKEVVDAAGRDALVWGIAPEREGIELFMEYCKEVNPDIVFSMAHCEAQFEEIEKVKHYGIKLMTHCMNATGTKSKYRGVLGAGPNEYCFMHDDIYAELISDSMGIHVLPEMQRMLLKIKGIDKIILITDSFVSDADAKADFSFTEDLSFDVNGDLSGSKLTMDKACKNFSEHTGAGICDVFKAAALNGAKLLGLDKEIGSIKEGKRANLVICDDKFNVKKVILEGNIWR